MAEQFDRLLADVASYNPDVDGDLLERAYSFASEAHERQEQRSEEDVMRHPLGVALILAEHRSDDATIAGGLLHDILTGSDVTTEQVRSEFGDEVARLVEGVATLTTTHLERQELADDDRIVLVKLADRLHDMRTNEDLGKQKKLQTAREALEIYAPLAQQLGLASMRSELEDRAFQTLHPRKYDEIQAIVKQPQADRERSVEAAGKLLAAGLEKVDTPAEISSRARHLYSIYSTMAKGGKEFNEIYDLGALCVLIERDGVEGERDCYQAIAVSHSLWAPMPGRFKDYIAEPRLNMRPSLYTTVMGPDGTPLEIQVRRREKHWRQVQAGHPEP